MENIFVKFEFKISDRLITSFIREEEDKAKVSSTLSEIIEIIFLLIFIIVLHVMHN